MVTPIPDHCVFICFKIPVMSDKSKIRSLAMELLTLLTMIESNQPACISLMHVKARHPWPNNLGQQMSLLSLLTDSSHTHPAAAHCTGQFSRDAEKSIYFPNKRSRVQFHLINYYLQNLAVHIKKTSSHSNHIKTENPRKLQFYTLKGVRMVNLGHFCFCLQNVAAARAAELWKMGGNIKKYIF